MNVYIDHQVLVRCVRCSISTAVSLISSKQSVVTVCCMLDYEHFW